MDGGQAIVKSLEAQGVEYIFGYSGGAAIPIFDALVTTNTKIKFILVRHEQGASHMADGYARATGKPAVVLVTSGPGATNVITGLMTAQMDSVPMICLTGQCVSWMLGKDAFQEADIFGICMPVVKHSYMLKKTDDIPRVIREAFHIATTGRPGPVLIDIPKDVSAGPCRATLVAEMDIPGYKTHADAEINQTQIQNIAEALAKSQKPLILAGHGAMLSGAQDALLTLAEKLNAPVTTTILGKGVFPETHKLSLGWLGMHGSAYANKAICDCDLLVNFGSRFDDRILGDPKKFCKQAKIVHVDIDPSEIGKMIVPDLHCVGDARKVIEALIPHVAPINTTEWLKKLEGWKQKYPFKFKRQGNLKMQ
ncbi:MAG: acetolactate synthase large subunit, partial [Kiritimatiellaceae bacterium]|nr:acetolactate synthase large subunit [Kiritimatiellaceae bacterium]